ncbi:hypothetical protein F0562_001158 [Nyssa sinensis]|uniref:F-box/LRR-repeat protein 15-like leucin rich repeat domain-containing protein n=1 Tax=Nyssa sinensis TaxID=561372 RepID=A0A5J5C3U3_9ASTE|nr:hypothetical protein F0562_001158 [Nyssa sinensis]
MVHSLLYRLLMGQRLRSIDLSRSRFFTNVGLSSLVMNCSALVEIDLSNGTELTDSAAAVIAEAKNLESLRLTRCKLISDIGIGCIAVGCKKLRLVCLKWCLRVSDLGVGLIAIKCKEIRSLDLSYLPITEKCLRPILQLQHLKELVLVGCPGIDDEGLAMLKQGCKSLETLNMSNCQNVSHVGLSSLTNGAGSLCQLILAYGPAVTADLAKCLQNFLTLQSIKLDGCLITCSGMQAIANCSCQLLEELDVTDNEINDEGLEFISRCRKLSRLKLGICMNMTDDGLSHIGSCCPKLAELDLYRCMGVTDVGIAAIAQNCSALEIINMAYCDKITDTSLISLSKCLRLKVLEVRGCSCISSAGLSAIAVGCRQLTVLDIKKCYNINDTGMLPLAQYSQILKQINLSYCSVTDVGLLALASISHLQNMTILHVSGLTLNGLAAALLACGGLTKVKLHASFKASLPKSLLNHMEARGCVFQWRDKAFQVEIDPKGWKLHFGREIMNPEAS